MARSDGTVVGSPTAVSPAGVPVYERPSFGFILVVEGRPGATGAPMGRTSFQWSPGDPSVRPDLQMIVSRPLGDGSADVCDDAPGRRGGVPATAEFGPTQAVADAISDLGCRFKDAAGNPGGRGPADACTRMPDGTDRFRAADSTVQFCALVDRPFAFPRGDTLVTVRLRDVAGHLSAPAALVVRVP